MTERRVDSPQAGAPRPASTIRTNKSEKQTRRDQPRQRPTSCAYCGGPLPPPAVTGRPRTFCSAQCRAANEWIVVSDRRDEMRRREQEQREVERRAREEEAARRREREYQQALAAGGAVAANARWERLYDETYDKYGGRYGLCQWEDEDDDGNYEGRCCTRRTADVYCWRHNRQLERETAKRRHERDASLEANGGMPRPEPPLNPSPDRRE
jgi:hypothetical protein